MSFSFKGYYLSSSLLTKLINMKKWFFANIEELTLDNDNFRKVLYTGKNLQLVLMSIKVWEDIWMEVHPEHDQFIRFESGTGKVTIDETVYQVKAEDAVVVPAWAKHNVENTWDDELKIYTVYWPAHHEEGIIHTDKKDAEENDRDFDWTTTE